MTRDGEKIQSGDVYTYKLFSYSIYLDEEEITKFEQSPFVITSWGTDGWLIDHHGGT